MKLYSVLILAILTSGCYDETAHSTKSTTHEHYVTSLADMHKIVVGNGETVYQAEGRNIDMETMSFVITETRPGGGPPLHVHPVEEAHVVLSGTVKYFIADSVFTVSAPFIVNIPPNAPHTFINAGDTVLNLIGVFGQDNYGPYKPMGDNPLIN
ncbi:MAG: cupin domain-containing protein [Chitinophagales bacterium]|nr:cupin domain-containing protein [Chitinophagales bacterium]